MSGNLEVLYGYAIPDQDSDEESLIVAGLKKHIASARQLWATLTVVAGRLTGERSATIDSDLERLPGHLQRDVGVTPDLLSGRQLRVREVDAIESPRMVRARLVAAWPELQR